jgi:hypothetical protein
MPQESSSGERGQRLYSRGKGAEAIREYTEDGLVVFEDSTARLDIAPSVGSVE